MRDAALAMLAPVLEEMILACRNAADQLAAWEAEEVELTAEERQALCGTLLWLMGPGDEGTGDSSFTRARRTAAAAAATLEHDTSDGETTSELLELVWMADGSRTHTQSRAP